MSRLRSPRLTLAALVALLALPPWVSTALLAAVALVLTLRAARSVRRRLAGRHRSPEATVQLGLTRQGRPVRIASVSSQPTR